MKKLLWVFIALLPLSGMADTLNSNNNNNPNQPGYNPSQQRLQNQMQSNQIQQQNRLRQDQQWQTQQTQRRLQEQRNSTQQRVLQSQPGDATRYPPVNQQNGR
ncbi:DUF2756 domain-containing protein [Mixta tenebrionis]|uniref:DUF2756 domain-containing protein n=1 Tax=Mixta tenebrionis TaxID=2562439 RepID=A0A506V8L7_9GAMM|nr:MULTISPECIES: DUF2756 domain-containing protein [Mixta]QHM77239.1 hypothetical protein C7M52_03235 [Mixta theicola]TPW42037.1 DUF2756 domain-containing protein [Mixta tenebrionis]